MNSSAVILLVPSIADCTAVITWLLCTDSAETISLGASRTPKEASLLHLIDDALCLCLCKVKQSTFASFSVDLIDQGMQGNLSKSFHHVIWMSVEVERFAVAHIVQLAVCSFLIVDTIEEVIDLFDASFEKVSIVFAEGLVTDFEVLFHGLSMPFWLCFVNNYFCIASWWILSTLVA
jgi:hypothetical protein